jgi:uncharacterized protein YeaO (DUF488 family)
MLARFSRTLGQKSTPKSQGQIKKRNYALLARDANAPGWAPSTTVLQSVTANAAGHKTLAEAYKEAIDQHGAARDQLLSTLNSELSKSPYATVRNAAASLSSVLSEMTPEIVADSAKATLPSGNINDILEVHEVAELHEAYMEAFSKLPYVPTDQQVSLDPLVDSLASFTAELNAAKAQLAKITAKANAQLETASANATNLMYSKADDVLNAHPELEAQMEEEIRNSRWELVNSDE